MKRYTITVNGIAYDVTVDESGNASAPVATAPAPAATPAPAAAPAESASAQAGGSEGSVKVESPMPGTILDIKVSIGQAVENGQVLCVLEAMKMENDIVAPQAGTVASINVAKGDSVEAGTVILTLN